MTELLYFYALGAKQFVLLENSVERCWGLDILACQCSLGLDPTQPLPYERCSASKGCDTSEKNDSRIASQAPGI